MKNTKRYGHISYMPNQNYPVCKKVSSIRLSGQWIEDAGFNVGDAFEINIRKSRLTISKIIAKESICEEL